MKKFNLEERLIDYSVLTTEIVENIHNSRAGNHFAGQLIRCGTSPALNYAEAQSGESRWKEADELISIFVKCILTAKKNMTSSEL